MGKMFADGFEKYEVEASSLKCAEKETKIKMLEWGSKMMEMVPSILDELVKLLFPSSYERISKLYENRNLYMCINQLLYPHCRDMTHSRHAITISE